MQISQLKETSSDADRTLDFKVLDFQITQLTKKVNVLQEQNELFRAENEKVKQHYKELYDSIKITHAKHIEQTTALLTANDNLKAQIHENLKCITMDSVKPIVLAPGRYAIDVEPIPPRNRNNREVHLDYLKDLKESVETLHEIVEEAKVERPLDSSLASACLYTKHSQELLEYVIGTSQLNIQKTNVLVPPSTGVNSCTNASGSQPRSNTKKNRILLAKSVNKKKVKEHPRTNKSSLKTTNRIDSSISSKCTVINSNSHSVDTKVGRSLIRSDTGNKRVRIQTLASQIMVLQLTDFTSEITDEELREFTSEYYIPSALHPVVPAADASIADFPVGKVGVYTRFFEFANQRVPLSLFMCNVLNHYRLHISQLHCIGAAKISNFEVNCRLLAINPTVHLFRAFYHTCWSNGWVSFSKRAGRLQCYTEKLDALRRWREMFFWVDDALVPWNFAFYTQGLLPRDERPPPGSYSMEDAELINENRIPINAYSEAFLCHMGISRNYFRSPEEVPTFIGDDGQGGCLSFRPPRLVV
ncbi:hypothetical protein Tco_0256692, partial [Tanacetum coccineum]